MMAYKEFDYRLSSNGLCTKIPPTSYFPNESKAAKRPATISESVIKAAHEGIEAQPLISDVEKAARAIAEHLGHHPDSMAFRFEPLRVTREINLVPASSQPLWTYFVQEAEAALNAVTK